MRRASCVNRQECVPLCPVMRYIVFDDMTRCSPAEVTRLMPLASAQRQAQALRYSHTFGQFCCLKSYEMLLTLLREWGRAHNTNAYDTLLPEFLYNDYGQPCLVDGPYFSISHSKNAIAVCVDDTPVGVDVESVRPLRRELVAKTMSAREQSLIAASVPQEWAFTRLWTQKEALLKLRGTGIIADLRNTLDDCADVSFHSIDNLLHNYVLTIAIQKIQEHETRF